MRSRVCVFFFPAPRLPSILIVSVLVEVSLNFHVVMLLVGHQKVFFHTHQCGFHLRSFLPSTVVSVFGGGNVSAIRPNN